MDCLNKELKKYIEENILMQYEKNDKGHGLSHIEYVTQRCFKFATQFSNINTDMLYTIASFHDIAHHIDKAHHEILSAEIFYKDEAMKRFFTEEERFIIKEAIEDHRASSKGEPRSDYGKIISSADRSTDVEEFLRRTHAYTLKHFKGISEEEIIERGYTHTKEKYGAEGYAKHYVVDEEYNQFRDRINYIINDKKLFREVYKNINERGGIINSFPDVEVVFEFNGTRKNPAADGYRPHHLVTDTYLTTGVHHYYDTEWVQPDGIAKGTITFLSPEAYPNCLWVGRRINIQEGARIVGYATITKIFNPILEK